MSNAAISLHEDLPPDVVRVYVWELPVRLTHWLIAGSIGVLAVTGLYIGDPFLVAPGEARYRFVMGTMKAIHSWAAIVFVLSVGSRVLWMFAGNKYANWCQFFPMTRHRWRNLPRTLFFYLFVSRKPPEHVGHNPLAGLAYSVVFLLYALMIFTGLGLYGRSAHVDSWLAPFAFLSTWFGGPQTARWLHHVGMWFILAFFAHHVFSALLVSQVEKNGIMDSIFSGYKYISRKVLEEEDSCG
jgi:Ni/Fe-hydrogenase 1 B-type cytochrome subunit